MAEKTKIKKTEAGNDRFKNLLMIPNNNAKLTAI